MLKILRKKGVSKMVLWALLILILPAFVIWGTGSLGGTKGGGPKFVGIIDNKKISFDKFADSLTTMGCQVRLNYFNQPKVIEAFFSNKPVMGKMAWERLVILSEVKKSKIRISDADVVNYIRSLPVFFKNGRFNDELYNYGLKNYLGVVPRAFEEMIRENLAIQKLYANLTKDIKAADEKALNLYKLDNQKFKVSYILLPEDAEKTYGEIMDNMVKQNLTFEAASAKVGLKAQETPLFARSDYIDNLGEAGQLTGEAVKLNTGDVSSIVPTRKGMVVFKLLETQGIDEEKFKKEKDEYNKKALGEDKNKFLEKWLTDTETKTTLNIDLKDYEKYYH